MFIAYMRSLIQSKLSKHTKAVQLDALREELAYANKKIINLKLDIKKMRNKQRVCTCGN